MDPDDSAGLDHAEAETAARSDVRHRASGAPLPAQIGPYHIIELLGQGGMGAVYLAEQTQPFRRRVAVKVIKPGMDSEQVIARFETERQALALMNHPNVARVLDAAPPPTGGRTSSWSTSPAFRSRSTATGTR
jgi:eukaryotic-like serine/threonine-protein kinase